MAPVKGTGLGHRGHERQLVKCSEKKEAVRTVRHAFENGINYYDLAAGDGTAFATFKEALHDVRDQVMYQIHFGADYSNITYGWSLDLDTVKRSVDRQLKNLGTDYINYGFIHCQDESSDWKSYRENGILEFLLSMKEQGVVQHIGASSHTPSVIQEILDTGLIDMLMFSVNPAYDYQHGEYAFGGVDERSEVYRRCEKGSYEDHAHRGAEYARQLLTEMEITTAEETKMICSAIWHHDSKAETDVPMDEFSFQLKSYDYGCTHKEKLVCALFHYLRQC